MYSKQLEMEKNKALATQKYDFEGTMVLSRKAKQDLEWLMQNLSASLALVFFQMQTRCCIQMQVPQIGVVLWILSFLLPS